MWYGGVYQNEKGIGDVVHKFDHNINWDGVVEKSRNNQ